MNFYKLAADLVAAVHLGYVSFVVVGMGLILVGVWRGWGWVRNFWFRTFHFLMIAVVVAEALGGIVCPLTNWEYELRVAGGGTADADSFVGRIVLLRGREAHSHAAHAPEWPTHQGVLRDRREPEHAIVKAVFGRQALEIPHNPRHRAA